MNKKNILFVGNASYKNRGCEAIVRGTMEILRETISSRIEVQAGSYGASSDLAEQARMEIDKSVSNFPLSVGAGRWSRQWWELQANKRFGFNFPAQHGVLSDHLREVETALEIGGDNFSLDYGVPRHLILMDQFIQSRNIPVIIWGASIGPFDKEPQFAEEMFSHLRSLKAIFVRESLTFKYLADNGVTGNVYLVADPAFMMKPVEPAKEKLNLNIPPECIGLNFSPLVGKTFLRTKKQVWELTEEDLAPWFDFCVICIKKLSSAAGRPILLIPHVGSSYPGIDDFSFLKRLHEITSKESSFPVLSLPDGLNAAESKWAISKCAVFAGARTHATIAGLSTYVPTLSFGYSVKARGINKDIYGSLDYCLDVNDISVDQIVDTIQKMLENENDLRSFLAAKMPMIRELALSAGHLLSKMLIR